MGQERATGGDEGQERGGQGERGGQVRGGQQGDRYGQERERDMVRSLMTHRVRDKQHQMLQTKSWQVLVTNFLTLWQDQVRFRLCVVTVLGLRT